MGGEVMANCPFCKAEIETLDYATRGWEGGTFYSDGDMRERWSDSEEFILSCPECKETLDLSTDDAMDFLLGNYTYEELAGGEQEQQPTTEQEVQASWQGTDTDAEKQSTK
jgi:uncharacterized protein YbaR (Trm112 family)